MITSPTIPKDWIELMIKGGIPITLEHYRKLIDDGRKPDELSEEEKLKMFGNKKTPKGWGSASVYME